MNSNFLKKFVSAIYFHYRKKFEPEVALFQAKCVVAFVFGFYILIFHYIVVKFRVVQDYDISDSKILIGLIFALPPYLVIHYFSPKLSELTNDIIPFKDSEIDREWFKLYLIFGGALCLFGYLLYTYGGLSDIPAGAGS
jgi:hypothetical protein